MTDRYTYFNTFRDDIEERLISLDFAIRAIQTAPAPGLGFSGIIAAAHQVEKYLFRTPKPDAENGEVDG